MSIYLCLYLYTYMHTCEHVCNYIKDNISHKKRIITNLYGSDIPLSKDKRANQNDSQQNT